MCVCVCVCVCVFVVCVCVCVYVCVWARVKYLPMVSLVNTLVAELDAVVGYREVYLFLH